MRNHFRTAVLTIILTGGTMISYATAYVMMDEPKTPASVSAPVSTVPPAVAPALDGRIDISVRETCAGSGSRAERHRCMQASASRPSVRVIDIAAGASETLIR